MQKIPIYKVDMEDPEHGLTKVSFVENPAIESDFIALSKKEQEVALAKDEQKMILTGALMIPEKKILRVDAEGNPFYIVFSADQIEEMRNKFFAESKINLTNLEHDFDLSGNYIVESWIVQDSEKDKSVAIGLGSFPVGTMMVSYKVTDEKFWTEKVMTGEVKGFSLEGLFALNELKLKKDTMNKPILKTILSNIKNLWKIELMEMTLEDGRMIWQDEEDGSVYLINEDGSRGELLADGEYILDNGEVINIVEGKITAMENKEEEEEMSQVKAELEEAKSKISELEAKLSASELEAGENSERLRLSTEEVEKSVSEIEQKDSKIAELEAELSELKEENIKLKKVPASRGIEEEEGEQSRKPKTAIERILEVSK